MKIILMQSSETWTKIMMEESLHRSSFKVWYLHCKNISELFISALAKNKNKPKNYEIQKMFDEIDSDQTGDIDYNEFKELARRWMHILSTGVPETSNFSNKRAKTRRVGIIIFHYL